jgi:hypothetical protein
MDNPIVSQLQDAIRRLEGELGEIEQSRGKKKRELKEHRRALDILSGKKRKERKPRNGTAVN